MIVEVAIAEETPRRYQLRRDGDRIVVRRVHEEANDGANDHANGANDSARGAETAIDWRRPQRGIYSLLVEDRSFEVFVEPNGDHLAVHLRSRTYRVRAHDVRRHRPASMEDAIADGAVRITAPIPGRVARVLVAPGEQVTRGDGIVVVEAMKMENELRSPRDGVVGDVLVEEGQGVEGGALLATIE